MTESQGDALTNTAADLHYLIKRGLKNREKTERNGCHARHEARIRKQGVESKSRSGSERAGGLNAVNVSTVVPQTPLMICRSRHGKTERGPRVRSAPGHGHLHLRPISTPSTPTSPCSSIQLSNQPITQPAFQREVLIVSVPSRT